MMVCSRPGETRKMISTWTAVWVKICASWTGLLLYLWTLVAPLLLPNRDFSLGSPLQPVQPGALGLVMAG